MVIAESVFIGIRDMMIVHCFLCMSRFVVVVLVGHIRLNISVIIVVLVEMEVLADGTAAARGALHVSLEVVECVRHCLCGL